MHHSARKKQPRRNNKETRLRENDDSPLHSTGSAPNTRRNENNVYASRPRSIAIKNKQTNTVINVTSRNTRTVRALLVYTRAKRKREREIRVLPSGIMTRVNLTSSSLTEELAGSCARTHQLPPPSLRDTYLLHRKPSLLLPLLWPPPPTVADHLPLLVLPVLVYTIAEARKIRKARVNYNDSDKRLASSTDSFVPSSLTTIFLR